MLKECFESSKALYRMYKVLANHTINRTQNSEEYKLVLSLLEDAIKFEQQKIDALTFTPETIRVFYNEIESYCYQNSNIKDESDTYQRVQDEAGIIAARMDNIINDINVEISRTEKPTGNNFFEMLPQMIAYNDYINKKINTFYLKYQPINEIYVLSIAHENALDNETREFLIHLMYILIFTTPSYEEIFKTSKTIRKPISLSDYIFELEFYDKEKGTTTIEYLLIEKIKRIEEEIIKLKDIDLSIKKTYFNYVKDMIEYLSCLICFKDLEQIDMLKEEFDESIVEVDSTERIRILNDVNYLFEAAKRIMENKNKEKSLNYGSSNKETN